MRASAPSSTGGSDRGSTLSPRGAGGGGIGGGDAGDGSSPNASKTSLNRILRLLCLYSLVYAGVPGKQLDLLRKAILEVYGFEVLPTLLNLEKIGLLCTPEKFGIC